MIVDTDLEKNEIFCKRVRCSRFIGTIVEDGQAIEIGNVRIFNVAVLICVCCKPYRFEAKRLDTDLIDTYTLEKEFNF